MEAFSISHNPPIGLLQVFSTNPNFQGLDECNNKLFDDNEYKYESDLKMSATQGFDVVVDDEENFAEKKKTKDTLTGQRTSIYRGVTRHRWTGRYEAHLWDNSCRREGQSRKGRQVYLGGYDKEEKAARAFDLAALKYWGSNTSTNFPVINYERELEEMKNMTRQEFIASLRRRSSGFSRGASIYRGVTRHHQHGRWQARIGRVAGNKDLYLGTFSTQEEAAEAYDVAVIKFRGLNAVTNFDMNRYNTQIILNSELPIGRLSNKSSKTMEQSSIASYFSNTMSSVNSCSLQNVQKRTPKTNPGQQHDHYLSLLAPHDHQTCSGFEMFSSGITMDFTAHSNQIQKQQEQSFSSTKSPVVYTTPIIKDNESSSCSGYNYHSAMPNATTSTDFNSAALYGMES